MRSSDGFAGLPDDRDFGFRISDISSIPSRRDHQRLVEQRGLHVLYFLEGETLKGVQDPKGGRQRISFGVVLRLRR